MNQPPDGPVQGPPPFDPTRDPHVAINIIRPNTGGFGLSGVEVAFNEFGVAETKELSQEHILCLIARTLLNYNQMKHAEECALESGNAVHYILSLAAQALDSFHGAKAAEQSMEHEGGAKPKLFTVQRGAIKV